MAEIYNEKSMVKSSTRNNGKQSNQMGSYEKSLDNLIAEN